MNRKQLKHEIKKEFLKILKNTDMSNKDLKKTLDWVKKNK